MSTNSNHSRGPNSTHSRGGNLSPKPSGVWGKGSAATVAAIRTAPPPAPTVASSGLSPVPTTAAGSGGAPSNRVRAYSGSNVAVPQQGQFASSSSHHRRKRFSHPNPNNKGAVAGGAPPPGRGGDGGGGRGGDGGGGGSQHQRTGGGGSQHQRTGGGGGSQHHRTHNNNNAVGFSGASPGGSMRNSVRNPPLPQQVASAVPPPPSLTPLTTPKQHGTPKQQHHQHHHNHQQQQQQQQHHHHHHPHKKRDLLLTGQGSTPAQKAVQRVAADVMLQLRLAYLDPPEQLFSPPDLCAWTNEPTRAAQIEEMAAHKRQGGDVSKITKSNNNNNNNNNTTAPPLEDCAPLQVNEETRWKAKVFTAAANNNNNNNSNAEQSSPANGGAGGSSSSSAVKDDILPKALLILNKLSWTTMDKLSQELMTLYWEVLPANQESAMPTTTTNNDTPTTTTDEADVQQQQQQKSHNNNDALEVLKGIIHMIVDKAQAEQHFAGMYAQLCATLHKLYAAKAKEDVHKKNVGDSSSQQQPPPSQKLLKKLLLEECQDTFHQDSMQKLQESTQNSTSAEEIAYHALLIRKQYVGLMRFLGELYCRDMIKIGIMTGCLKHLLQLQQQTDQLSDSKTEEPQQQEQQPSSQTTESSESAAEKQNGTSNNGSATATTTTATTTALTKSRDDAEVEEEKLECFSKLITTIGSMLEQQASSLRQSGKPQASLELQECWEYVYLLAGRTPPPRIEVNNNEKGATTNRPPQVSKVSNRLKFMLQDLIDLKEKGWVSRRAVETAKTISELHQEVANEEAAAQQQTRRSTSSGNLRASVGTQPTNSGGMARRTSDGRIPSLRFKQQQQAMKPGRANAAVLRRSVSDGSSLQRMSSMSEATLTQIGEAVAGPDDGKVPSMPGPTDKMLRSKSMSVVEYEKASSSPSPPPPSQEEPTKYLSPEKCGDKMNSILREYFVNGDTDDAALSIHELVGAKTQGSVARGAKVVEAGVFHVLEMKPGDVQKMMKVLTRCVEKGEIEKESFEAGLLSPLEFLNDIEIDAPLAGLHLATIVAELIELKMISLDFLLKSPESFLSEGKPARFAAKVVKASHTKDVSDDDLKVIADLMSDEDRAAFPTASALLSSV